MFHLRVFSISVYENLKCNYHLPVLANFPDMKVIQFWSGNCMCHISKLYLFWTCPKFWIFIFQCFREQWKSRICRCEIYLIAIVLETLFFCTFWRLNTFVLLPKIVLNYHNSRETFINSEWQDVERCPTIRWIAFWMLYRLMYNIPSHSMT